MRQILAALLEHYDRLIVFVVLLGLFWSLSYLTVRKMDLDQKIDGIKKAVEAYKPRHPVMAPVTSEPFDLVMAEVKEPFRIPTAWSNSLFAPEERVRCTECLKPTPISVEKCPSCGALVMPKEVQKVDEDNDGMRDDWERKYGLNPHDRLDADLDQDDDGFSNLEEFLLGALPNDPNNHPDFANKVKVVRAYQVPFNLRFLSHMKGTDFQVNTVDNGKTYFVKLGGKVGEKGDEFVVEKFREAVTNRVTAGIMGAHPVDVSVLTLARGEKRIPLVLGERVSWPELRAALAFAPDKTNWVAKVGDVITVRKINYVVMDIDSKAGSVVLRRADSGTTFSVGANGVVVNSEAERSEPEEKAPETREGE